MTDAPILRRLDHDADATSAGATTRRDATELPRFVRAKSPLRISFAGGGTDLPSYYNDRGGAVLVATIDKYSYVSLVPRTEPDVRISSLDFDIDVKFNLGDEPIPNGVLDLAKAAIRRFNVTEGFELSLQSDAPPGSGLGSSSSMTVAIIGAMLEWLRGRLDPYEIAELAYTIERRDLGIAGGKQDQYAAAFGGFNHIEFSAAQIAVTPLRIRQDVLNDLEAHLLLCYTGHTRLSSGLIEKQVRYYAEGRRDTLEGMARLHQLCPQMRDALTRGDLAQFAELLEEASVAKKQMNPHITDERIDAMSAAARNKGALAGKILGAGGGGFMLVFVPVDARKQVRRALEELGGQFVSFGFEVQGLASWASGCP
ncbi:MAG TPA: hypothetical protein VLV45_15240 [Gemmatimonadales bacterium]|nr:hypothetical protein [Gemmatimonadales bacterium]